MQFRIIALSILILVSLSASADETQSMKRTLNGFLVAAPFVYLVQLGLSAAQTGIIVKEPLPTPDAQNWSIVATALSAFEVLMAGGALYLNTHQQPRWTALVTAINLFSISGFGIFASIWSYDDFCQAKTMASTDPYMRISNAFLASKVISFFTHLVSMNLSCVLRNRISTGQQDQNSA